MSTATRARTARRTRTALALAALVPGLILGGAGQALAAERATATAVVPGAQETARAVESGELSWGVRSSIRNYLENFAHTEGWIAAYSGATYEKGDAAAVFPVTSGTVDPDAGTADISFQGQFEMFGFGEDWLYFEDIRLEIAEDQASIVVDMIESYNVKTRTDDLTLATFDLEPGSLQPDADGTLTLTTGEGAFPYEVGDGHLPSYGGPTYVGANDWTDPFTLTVSLADAGGDEDDDNDDDGGAVPGDGDDGADAGAYGTSYGTSLSGTTSSIRVSPGYAIAADGSTTLTLEGVGFDPGPAVTEGTGSGGIYVGFGAMADSSDPEVWRRSNGGISGPQGSGDYTYGVPLFVANQGTADADVADAVMNADGTWTATVTIPGSSVDSFFGDTIDCLSVQCGVFSFGAHGIVSAANEAYTPVYFVGQDESGWPDRDDDDPTPVPSVTPEKPTESPSTLPTDASLTETNRGDVQVLSVSSSRVATVSVGTESANTWVGVSTYSDPQFVNWFLVATTGRIQVTLPDTLDLSETHKLSVIAAADESLIGWDDLPIEEQAETPGTDIPDKGDPYGTSTGTNSATGATLTVTPAWSLGDSEQRVTLTGTGYATSNNGSNFGGAYILFGVVVGDSWEPSEGGRSGFEYMYADGAGTYQQMVNYPGNTTEPDLPYIQADGSWEFTDFPIIGSQFTATNGTEIDCYVQQCGIITIGAHGSANAGVEVFTPVSFTDERPPGTAPALADNGGIVANPNLATSATGAGLSAQTGADALPGPARTLFIVGVLVLSIGGFGAAVLYATRRRPIPIRA